VPLVSLREITAEGAKDAEDARSLLTLQFIQLLHQWWETNFFNFLITL